MTFSLLRFSCASTRTGSASPEQFPFVAIFSDMYRLRSLNICPKCVMVEWYSFPLKLLTAPKKHYSNRKRKGTFLACWVEKAKLGQMRVHKAVPKYSAHNQRPRWQNFCETNSLSLLIKNKHKPTRHVSWALQWAYMVHPCCAGRILCAGLTSVTLRDSIVIWEVFWCCRTCWFFRWRSAIKGNPGLPVWKCLLWRVLSQGTLICDNQTATCNHRARLK